MSGVRGEVSQQQHRHPPISSTENVTGPVALSPPGLATSPGRVAPVLSTPWCSVGAVMKSRTLPRPFSLGREQTRCSRGERLQASECLDFPVKGTQGKAWGHHKPTTKLREPAGLARRDRCGDRAQLCPKPLRNLNPTVAPGARPVTQGPHGPSGVRGFSPEPFTPARPALGDATGMGSEHPTAPPSPFPGRLPASSLVLLHLCPATGRWG